VSKSLSKPPSIVESKDDDGVAMSVSNVTRMSMPESMKIPVSTTRCSMQCRTTIVRGRVSKPIPVSMRTPSR